MCVQILPFLEAAVEARAEIAPALSGNRDLLYLDVALENSIRGAAERGVGSAGFGAAAFMAPLLQNLCLSMGNNEEACFCLKVRGRRAIQSAIIVTASCIGIPLNLPCLTQLLS